MRNMRLWTKVLGREMRDKRQETRDKKAEPTDDRRRTRDMEGMLDTETRDKDTR
jgi:hypothetical protein